MKLGIQTGSVVNHLQSRSTIGQPEPVVGMGATILLWSDRKAATISQVQVVRGRTIISVKRDYVKVISGSTHDGTAEYEYHPNPAGREEHFRREESGRWQRVIIDNRTGRFGAAGGGGPGLRIGERETYIDPTF